MKHEGRHRNSKLHLSQLKSSQLHDGLKHLDSISATVLWR